MGEIPVVSAGRRLDVRERPLWHPDSLIPERCAGPMSSDPKATQTAVNRGGFHQQRQLIFSPRWCHGINKFPVDQQQQVTGRGGGGENALSVASRYDSQLGFHRMCVCMRGGSRGDPLWAAAALSQHGSVPWILDSGESQQGKL